MPDYIITADDKAREEGYPSARVRMRALFAQLHKKHPALKFDERPNQRKPIKAEINFGRWVAICECGGSEYVTPDDPVMWCCSCANAPTGKVRPVIFPGKREEIEALVLERPVEERRGFSEAERAMNSRPLIGAEVGGEVLPLSRSWTPDESLADLRRQNKAVDKWKKLQEAD